MFIAGRTIRGAYTFVHGPFDVGFANGF